ncbi:MAG: [FeFe] hydrogenase H-cluster radical SAM maturase HydE [bacterium]
MCYSIPGKIKEVNGKFVIVDYFGELRKARNEFFEVNSGEYVYAQGGFVISKVPEKKALELLKTWKEIFLKLKETDLRLAQEPKTLYQIANSVRQQHSGNSCCVHGIIEFSNYCKNDCLYCGIRKSNKNIKRYRMTVDEIIFAANYAVNALGFKALVLQSGEDDWYTDEILVNIIKKIRVKSNTLLVVSIGERDISTYEKIYNEGARGVLMRFETSKKKLYEKLKPGFKLENRINIIKKLNKMGFLVLTGFLFGLPDQTEDNIINDIHLTAELQTEMFSFGPFIPHKDTPLAIEKTPSIEQCLNTIARTRILYPESKIVVTTAMETIDKNNGAKNGLMAGANSLMINVTPKKYKELYEIYPERVCANENVKTRIKYVLDLLYSIGRAPTDLGIN